MGPAAGRHTLSVKSTPPAVEGLLCDVDGNLFPSEGPAFEVSTAVINEFLSERGIEATVGVDEMREAALGRSFRHTIDTLASRFGVALSGTERERWVRIEQTAVTGCLVAVLEPDPAVLAPLSRLSEKFELAAVSSSATERIAACLEVTGLAAIFPAGRRFSAEDSLPQPMSKPDPAVYRLACQLTAMEPAAAVAVEDSVAGALSATGAGITTIGNLQFVPGAERDDRRAALLSAGVAAVVESWEQLELLLF